MKQIKFRQLLKPQYVKDGNPFHYWGYIEGGFTSPMGANYASADSEQHIMVDIYEGDIFHLGDEDIRYVAMRRCCDFVGARIGNKITVGISDFHEYIKIIGNIHQNPELLNNG